MCRASATHAGVEVSAHASTRLTIERARAADLVLAADREHRAVVARMAPEVRPRLFTLNQAASLSRHLRTVVASGVVPADAPPLPTHPVDRLRWLVAELDASRGLLAGQRDSSEDIVDRHGPQPHSEVFDEVVAAVDAITQAMDAVLDAG